MLANQAAKIIVEHEACFLRRNEFPPQLGTGLGDDLGYWQFANGAVEHLFVVAPVEATYDVRRLNDFMNSLTPDLLPDEVYRAQEEERARRFIRTGRLIYKEELGRVILRTKVEINDPAMVGAPLPANWGNSTEFPIVKQIEIAVDPNPEANLPGGHQPRNIVVLPDKSPA